MGKKGERAKDLRKIIDATLDLDLEYGTLTVRGEVEKVVDAREKLMEIINDFESKMVSESLSIRIAGKIFFPSKQYHACF